MSFFLKVSCIVGRSLTLFIYIYFQSFKLGVSNLFNNDIDTRRSCTKKEKGTISIVRGGPLYRENKKRFRDWVGVEGVRGYSSSKTEGVVVGKTIRGREFQSLEVIGINELANAFVRLISNLSA